MEIENILAKRISAAGIDRAYVEIFKRLPAQKLIRGRIVKICMEEFRECSIIDIYAKIV